MIHIKNYINGALIEPVRGVYFEDIEPATKLKIATIPDSNEKDVNLAVDAAQKAFYEWSSSSKEFRHKILFKISDLISERAGYLSELESMDNGKPVWLAREVDIPRAASNFRFFATAILHFASDSHYTEGQAINYTLRKPLGVVACISPWNLPLYLFTWKIAPALAAGNTVVAKPSELTPLTAFELSKICIEAGMPPGVLNIVHGYGATAGEALVKSNLVKAISFTGGTKTGERIAGIAAPKFKKLSLELGGKNPNLIFADCDYAKMLNTTVKSSFANQGQICLCGSRIYIEDKLYNDFKTDFISKVEQLKVGDPKDEDTNLGAINSEAHMQKILKYIELAKSEGGKILTGGHRENVRGRCENGFFIRPTVIEGLSTNCRTNQEEIFGPVVTIAPFSSDVEAIELANQSPYGLSATIWTNDLKRAHNMANQIDVGVIWINSWLLRDLRTPFGGMKNSGVGREGGWEALRFFTEPKNICIALK